MWNWKHHSILKDCLLLGMGRWRTSIKHGCTGASLRREMCRFERRVQPKVITCEVMCERNGRCAEATTTSWLIFLWVNIIHILHFCGSRRGIVGILQRGLRVPCCCGCCDINIIIIIILCWGWLCALHCGAVRCDLHWEELSTWCCLLHTNNVPLIVIPCAIRIKTRGDERGSLLLCNISHCELFLFLWLLWLWLWLWSWLRL